MMRKRPSFFKFHSEATLFSLRKFNFFTLFFSHQHNVNAEIANQGLDLFADSFQSVGEYVQQIKTHLPIIAWLLSLLGVLLRMVSVLLDRDKPWPLKIVAFGFLSIFALASTALFVFSVTNPLVVFIVAALMIAVDIFLEVGNVVCEWLEFVTCRAQLKEYKLCEAERQELTQCRNERLHLQQQLDEAIHRLHAFNEINDHAGALKIKQDIAMLQNALLKNRQRLTQLENKAQCLNSAFIKQKKELKSAAIGLCFCLMASTFVVVGMILATPFPMVGLALVAVALSFDLFEFGRNVRARYRQFQRQRTRCQQEEVEKNNQIVNAMGRCRRERSATQRSYAEVMKELTKAAPAVRPKVSVKRFEPELKRPIRKVLIDQDVGLSSKSCLLM